MKRRFIVLLTIVMGISFLALLIIQMRYMDEVLTLRRTHLQESVYRALGEVSHQLELAETARYLEQGSSPIKLKDEEADSLLMSSASPTRTNTTASKTPHQSLQDDNDFYRPAPTTSTSSSDKYYTKRNHSAVTGTKQTIQDLFKQRYAYKKALVDEIVYSILYTASDRPLQDRIDFAQLDQLLKSHFTANAINLTYHFAVYTSNGQCVYRCEDYDATG